MRPGHRPGSGTASIHIRRVDVQRSPPAAETVACAASPRTSSSFLSSLHQTQFLPRPPPSSRRFAGQRARACAPRAEFLPPCSHRPALPPRAPRRDAQLAGRRLQCSTPHTLGQACRATRRVHQRGAAGRAPRAARALWDLRVLVQQHQRERAVADDGCLWRTLDARGVVRPHKYRPALNAALPRSVVIKAGGRAKRLNAHIHAAIRDMLRDTAVDASGLCSTRSDPSLAACRLPAPQCVLLRLGSSAVIGSSVILFQLLYWTLMRPQGGAHGGRTTRNSYCTWASIRSASFCEYRRSSYANAAGGRPPR